jgi:hypothetical protein
MDLLEIKSLWDFSLNILSPPKIRIY